MAEEQDWDVPDSLRSSIYAVYIQGKDIYEMYEDLWIPAKYTDAIHAMWESWVEEDKKNPPASGVARMIPTGWPDLDNDAEPTEQDSDDSDAYEEADNEVLDKFRRRFGKLYDLYSRGTPEDVAIEILSIYKEFLPYYTIRDDFDGFRRSASNYLLGRDNKELVQFILQDVEFGDPNILYPGAPGSNLFELRKLKRRVTKDPLIHYHPVDEDWPEIDEEKK